LCPACRDLPMMVKYSRGLKLKWMHQAKTGKSINFRFGLPPPVRCRVK
jgi:hypothetical protein